MRQTKTIEKKEEIVTSITCDVCGKTAIPDDPKSCYEFQEFKNIYIAGGYGSIFGDCSSWECDLCQHCVKALLGKYLKEIKTDF